MKFILMPFIAWLTSGTLKFIINSIRFGKKARNLIGYGGLPSTHTAILSSTVFLCGFSEGFNTPIFSLGTAILIIIMFDAHGLRQKLKIGHTWIEIFAGLLLGMILAYAMSIIPL
ncbi:MAG: divergent PAP2 family protein [Selenomonadaceae bacterium]|nr:divergent PAP2 family protein [Selenomonadaceae bacterium]